MKRKVVIAALFAATLLMNSCETALSYKVQGDRFYERGRYEEAVQEYTRALQEKPRWPAAYNSRSVAYIGLQRYNLAVSDILTALETDPESGPPYNNLGTIYFSKGAYDDAIAAFNKALRINPKNVTAYSNLGDAEYEKGLVDKAIADYTSAVRLDSRFYGAYIGRGKVYLQKGSYDEALADFNKALSLRPGSSTAFFYRGSSYSLKGDYVNAAADFEKAVEISPKYGQAYLRKAAVSEMTGDIEKASETYEKLMKEAGTDASGYADLAKQRKYQNESSFAMAGRTLREHPEDPANHLAMASLFFKRYTESWDNIYLSGAIRETKEAISLAPGMGAAHLLIASLYVYKSVSVLDETLIREAVEEEKAGLSLSPELFSAEDMSGFQVMLSEAYMQLDELSGKKTHIEPSIAAAREAVRLNPSSSGCHMVLGKAFHKKGLREPAIAEFREALRLKPDDPRPYQALAGVFFEDWQESMDDETLENALKTAKDLVRMRPDNPEFHKILGSLYGHKGLYELDVFEAREAVRLSDSADSHTYLGVALLSAGDPDGAMKEYNKALEIDLSNVQTRYDKTFLYFLLDRCGEAMDELKKAVILDEGRDFYGILWRDICLRKQGKAETAQKALDDFERDFKGTEWKRSLLLYYRGAISEQELLSKTRNRGELCEAHYYIGQRYLVGGNTGKAKENFQKAINAGAYGYSEHLGAVRKLKDLDRDELIRGNRAAD